MTKKAKTILLNRGDGVVLRNENLFGKLIRYYRNERNLSQEKLADGICSREYIGKLERGENLPTLETMTLLSDRLGVDLHRAYSEVYQYRDLEIYTKILTLDKAIEKGDIKQISRLVNEYEAEDAFSAGQPLQCISYAKAIVTSHVDHDLEKALSYTTQGLCATHPFFPDLHTMTDRPSNIEFALILSYATTLCRMKKVEEAIPYYEYIINTAYHLLQGGRYEAESNRAFWLNIICSSVCNKFTFSDDWSEKVMDEIENVLEYQKKNDRVHMLPQLLLCKTVIQLKRKKREEARLTYRTAKTIGAFYHTPAEFSRMEITTVGGRFDVEELRKLG